MKNKGVFKDNCVSFFKDNLGKLYICIYVLQMYLEQYLMIYLWPKGKKCGLENITCRFCTWFYNYP